MDDEELGEWRSCAKNTMGDGCLVSRSLWYMRSLKDSADILASTTGRGRIPCQQLQRHSPIHGPVSRAPMLIRSSHPLQIVYPLAFPKESVTDPLYKQSLVPPSPPDLSTPQ